MKIADNKEEEYRAFLKSIREERRGGTSNFAKLLFAIVLAILCAVIVCVTIFENSVLLDRITASAPDEGEGFFKLSRRKGNFQVPFAPRKQNILLLGVDSNGQYLFLVIVKFTYLITRGFRKLILHTLLVELILLKRL